MNLYRQNVERGLARLYALGTLGWLIWIFLVLPIRTMNANFEARIQIGLPFDNRSWGEQWWQIMVTDGFAKEPVLTTFFVIGVPIIGYLLLITSIRLCYWVVAGFKKS
jgi:hypothetical protein